MDYFYSPNISRGCFYLDAEEAKHCVRVLRKKPGDQIIVLDGKGSLYTCTITEIQGKIVNFEILNIQKAEIPSCDIHIAIAPTKNIERIEWFLEKSIEVGVQRISYLLCDNSERKRVNMTRMMKKAISAIKQSQNPYLPVINDMIPFSDFINNDDKDSRKLICHAERGKTAFLLQAIEKRPAYQIVIGPEGDFTKDELLMAEKAGFTPVSLGRTRLRTETAGLVACILLNALNAQV
jgi:16S rRNA (uracil1498-N3)-methyltransferase